MGTQIKYPLRYDGRQIFFGRTQALPVSDALVDSSPPSSQRRFHPHERRQGTNSDHFNPVKGGFDVEVVNTFVDPDTDLLRYWVKVAPYIAVAIAIVMVIFQFVISFFSTYKSRKLRGEFFDALDLDGSGSLSRAEVMTGLIDRGCSEEEATKIFEKYDLDGHGVITRQEYDTGGRIAEFFEGTIGYQAFKEIHKDIFPTTSQNACAADTWASPLAPSIQPVARAVESRAHATNSDSDAVSDCELPQPVESPRPTQPTQFEYWL